MPGHFPLATRTDKLSSQITGRVKFMARGWESKSVEAQMDSAREAKGTGQNELSKDEKKLERERQKLLLSRKYIQHQMESSSNSRYTDSLRTAMQEIDHKLSELASHS
jgi:hypothetical protein